jgi:enamine deaminase RidA (YjgF/YER057c/UK114 family)
MTTFMNPSSVHSPTGYSHTAVVSACTELVFISGQVGIKPDGSVPSTLEEQSVQMFNNIKSLLLAHGLDSSSIVKMTLFVVVGQDIRVVSSASAHLLGDNKPTSTALFISQLVDPSMLVECEAIAAKPTR